MAKSVGYCCGQFFIDTIPVSYTHLDVYKRQTILCDVFIAFPSLIIAIAVIGVLGNGLQNIAVSVVLSLIHI